MENPSQPQNISSQTGNNPPKNWLIESILVTILCCPPFGIVGIINAANVNSRWATGDYEGAKRASIEAGRWTKIGFFVSIALGVLSILAIIAFGGMAALMNPGDFE